MVKLNKRYEEMNWLERLLHSHDWKFMGEAPREFIVPGEEERNINGKWLYFKCMTCGKTKQEYETALEY